MGALQLERCACNDPEATFCKWCTALKADQRRFSDWVGRMTNYLHPPVVRSFVFFRNGEAYKAVSYRGGPLELYVIGPDGLELSSGYARDVLGRAAG